MGNRRLERLLRPEFYRVTATWASAIRALAVRPSATGSRLPWPMAEQPPPESPTAVAVIRHLEIISIR